MKIHEERESFAAALRHAGEDIETPQAETLYGGAVRRGRQLRRRRALGTGAAGLVALAAAGALTAALSTGAAGRAAGAEPAGHAPAAVQPTKTPGVTAARVLQAFLAALPPNAEALRHPLDGGPPSASAPMFDGTMQSWYVSATASLKSPSPTGWSGCSLVLQQGIRTSTCAEAEAGSNTDTCTETPLDGGELVLDKTRHNPADPSSDPIWQYVWDSPAGFEVSLSIGDASVADFALTQPQVLSMLTDTAWQTLAAELPAKGTPGTASTAATPGATPLITGPPPSAMG